MIALILLLLPAAPRQVLRDNAFDVLLAADQRLSPLPHSAPPVIVVDIDRPSIEAIGPWPWPRQIIARLVTAIAARKPAAIAIDILFAEPDDRSPAALARRLGAITENAGIMALANTLPDGDKQLAEAMSGIPVVLGFVLDPGHIGAPQGPTIVSRGPLPFSGLWEASGAVGPPRPLAETASGLGALSLLESADGVIRRDPLFVVGGQTLLPGLAVEAVRLALGASSLLIDFDPPTLTLGHHRMTLPGDGLLRLFPVSKRRHDARTLPAAAVLAGNADLKRLDGAVVVVGGSAPELGGLRETPTDPFTPSVQIQADAIEQILAGRVPLPIDGTVLLQVLMVATVGAFAVAVGAVLSPLIGVLIIVCTGAALWGGALATALFTDRLFDPLAPSLAISLAFAVTSLSSYSVTRHREAQVRRRLEQHLAPAVVRRMVEQPGLIKLAGERREVTALFTDIEAFTAMTHRADPQQLIAALDHYFEGLAEIIFAHGGMIDKIVGDAVHALFNAPLDLADHPRRAVDCAIAIRDWSEVYRRTAGSVRLGFGRTRIGIETGSAVVGDVGIRSKLDYTAHGDAVNMASRLEAANKLLGSTICIGPGTAVRCETLLLRPLGSIEIAGREGGVTVFEPWPSDTTPNWRSAYLEAYRTIERDPVHALALFEKLSFERPNDQALGQFAKRVRLRADPAVN
ncbi:MAG TPA: adenylate/guanylate cyclase domain-containing protein [Xanthobacteraceae bacterium]|nr:adenylate/guanylate cyclase domain-containing protein [Xanthobacteraceae bacterium]